LKLKKKRLHILQVLTMLMLGVFSLAITPWSALHHHEQVKETNVEKNCTHKFHVKTQKETCLVCAAHFEKNYTVSGIIYTLYFKSKTIESIAPVLGSSFVALISTSLRGPPATC
jgi:hypothetical protein